MVLYSEAAILISDVSCFQWFHVVDYKCHRRLGTMPSLSVSRMDGQEIQQISKRW